MYDNGQYANSRLAGTIIRLGNGRPVTVIECEGAGEDIQVCYSYLSTGNRARGLYRLVEMDLTPVPLGWADHSRWDASYLVRIPKRNDWRQGLRLSNYSSVFGSDKREITASNLSKTILGNFLSFDDAVDEAVNNGKITPFSREFAVGYRGKEVELYFKWFGKVGDVRNTKFDLSDKFSHLQEVLEEAVA